MHSSANIYLQRTVTCSDSVFSCEHGLSSFSPVLGSNECRLYRTFEEKTLTLDVGSPCESFMGYCDFFSECRLAQEDGPLAVIIRGIFYSDEPQLADAILSWLQVSII